VGEYCVHFPDAEHESMSGEDLPGTLPDLTDPATIGCLLALVREAWGDSLHVRYTEHHKSWWVLVDRQIGVNGSGDTEGEALAAALLGAP
jgi:hypothetical protein